MSCKFVSGSLLLSLAIAILCSIPKGDDSEVIDHTGAGYSYFKKQQVDSRPSAPSQAILSSQDMSEYMRASAFKQQPAQTAQTFAPSNDQFIGATNSRQTISRINMPVTPPARENFVPSQLQRPINNFQNDFTAPQSSFSNSNFGSQQRDLTAFQAPTPTWQRKSTGFAPSFDDQFVRPASSDFLSQSNQQTNIRPTISAAFMPSQASNQAFFSQSQPTQYGSRGQSFSG